MTDILFQELNKGHWNIVLLVIMAVAIILLLKRYVKINDVRHKEHSRLDDLMTQNLVKLTTITEVHESEINNLKEDVKDVRFEFRFKKSGGK